MSGDETHSLQITHTLQITHSCQITGKHNIDQVFKEKKYEKSKRATNFDAVLVAVPLPTQQLDLLRNFFVGQHCAFQNELLSELRNKVSGYKAQDKRKEMLQVDLVTVDNVVEKLVGSQLRCCYCSKQVVVFYQNVREPTQWTLDRIDNDTGHSAANTVIACLKCNLQRRRQNEEKFMFTKKLKITRSE